MSHTETYVRQLKRTGTYECMNHENVGDCWNGTDTCQRGRTGPLCESSESLDSVLFQLINMQYLVVGDAETRTKGAASCYWKSGSVKLK